MNCSHDDSCPSQRAPYSERKACQADSSYAPCTACAPSWSGVAAGLSISFSLLAQALLQAHLPDTSWRPLLTSLGYPVGFLIVVLARQQLFTENTITPVLPLAAKFTTDNLAKLARLWTIVLAANMTGTAAAAAFCTLPPVLAPELRYVMIDISRHILETSWIESFFRAISAGFLIAAMVWLIPSAEAAAFHVISMMTYLIGVGGFQHIVAGSVDSRQKRPRGVSLEQVRAITAGLSCRLAEPVDLRVST